MKKTWIVSDWHFNHDRDFIYKSRGFNSVEEMNEEIIRRHNEVVSPEDDVFVLGDLMLIDNNKGLECIQKMNGNIHVILGNHDTDSRVDMYLLYSNIIKSVQYAYRLNYKKYTFYMSHCPMILSHEENLFKVYSLHGHTHSKEKFSEYPHCYNVALDAHDCYPVSLDQIIEDIKASKI